MVTKLQSSSSELGELTNSVKNKEVKTSCPQQRQDLNQLKNFLMNVVRYMDKITCLSVNDINRDEKQAAKLQSFADAVEANLYQARLELDPAYDGFNSDFQSLLKIYQEKIEKHHFSFARLNIPYDSFFLPFGKKANQEPILDKSDIIKILEDFIDFNTGQSLLDSFTEPVELSLDEALKKRFFPFFSTMTDTLAQELDLIEAEIKSEDKGKAKLEGLLFSVNRIHQEAQKTKVITMPELLLAIKNPQDFAILTKGLFGIADASCEIDFGDFVRTSLTLLALRRRFAQDDEAINFNRAQEASLRFYDQRANTDRLYFERIVNKMTDYITQIDNASSAQEARNIEARLLRDVSNGSFVKGFNENSKLERLIRIIKNKPDLIDSLKKSQFVLTQAGLNAELCQGVFSCSDNEALRNMLKKLADRVMINNSLSYRKTARLYYVLARTFVKPGFRE